LAGTADDAGGATAAVDARPAASAAAEEIEDCVGAANAVIGTSEDSGPALPDACTPIPPLAGVPKLVGSTGFAAFCTSCWPEEGLERFTTFDDPDAEGAACPAPDIIIVGDIIIGDIIASDIVVKGLGKSGFGFGKGPEAEGVLATAAASPPAGLTSDFNSDLAFALDLDLELRFGFKEFTPAALFEPAPELDTEPKLLRHFAPDFSPDFTPYSDSDFGFAFPLASTDWRAEYSAGVVCIEEARAAPKLGDADEETRAAVEATVVVAGVNIASSCTRAPRT
jgi:hypothetical protein